MKPIFLSTILYLFYTGCFATNDIVRFVYNDGFSYNEIEIPLRATKDERDRSIRTGSSNIPIADIYAARILSGPEDVRCVFEAVSKNLKTVDEKGNPRLKKVGRAVYKLNTVMQYTSPPQDVVQITCSVDDFDNDKDSTKLSRERQRWDADSSWGPFHNTRRMLLDPWRIFVDILDSLTSEELHYNTVPRPHPTGIVGEEGGQDDEDDESEDESL